MSRILFGFEYLIRDYVKMLALKFYHLFALLGYLIDVHEFLLCLLNCVVFLLNEFPLDLVIIFSHLLFVLSVGSVGGSIRLGIILVFSPFWVFWAWVILFGVCQSVFYVGLALGVLVKHFFVCLVFFWQGAYEVVSPILLYFVLLLDGSNFPGCVGIEVALLKFREKFVNFLNHFVVLHFFPSNFEGNGSILLDSDDFVDMIVSLFKLFHELDGLIIHGHELFFIVCHLGPKYVNQNDRPLIMKDKSSERFSKKNEEGIIELAVCVLKLL